MDDKLVERVARAIAIANGDDYDAIPRDRGHWIDERGYFDGRVRGSDEPTQIGYRLMAEAAIEEIERDNE